MKSFNIVQVFALLVLAAVAIGAVVAFGVWVIGSLPDGPIKAGVSIALAVFAIGSGSISLILLGLPVAQPPDDTKEKP